MKVGGKKGPSGAGGAGKAGGASKVGGAGFARKVEATGGVDRSGELQGPSAASGPAEVDPVHATALDIARQLKNGQLKDKDEATKRLVADILREKIHMQSKALTNRIADELQDDPRLQKALERLWAKAE